MTEDKKLKPEVAKTMDLLNKKFGAASIMRLGDDPGQANIEFISTGSLKLDRELGGGIPLGRSVEFYGPEMSGKTSLALLLAAGVQALPERNLVCFVDAEHTFNPKMAESYGVNVEDLIISRPDTGEEALDVAEAMIRTGEFPLVIIDSVSALVPEAEAESEMAQQHMGLQSRLMSKALRKLTPVASKHKCTVVFINQIREKIGVMYGNPETTSGGRALRFYASIRLHVRMGDRLESGKKVVGHIVKVKVVKNKIWIPFGETEFNLFYGTGVDTAGEIADIAVEEKLINQSGAWYSILDEEGEVANHPVTGEQLRWQGRNNLQDAFRSDAWLKDHLTERIKALTA